MEGVTGLQELGMEQESRNVPDVQHRGCVAQ